MRTDLRFYRARVASVLGVGGCCAVVFAACEPKSTTAGLLVVPTATATAWVDGAAPMTDGGTDATGLMYRPLPEEQHAARGQTCDREVTCAPALDVAPTWSYPPPFDRCGTKPNAKEGEGTFSQDETVDRRKAEPDACCYVKLDCGGSRGRGHGQVHVVPGRPRRGAAPDEDAAPCGKWTAMARMERSSVEAFLDFEADLRAHGAPPAHASAALAAAEDERSHATLCLALAARAGEDAAPAAAPVERPERFAPASLDELVRSTFLDGCVNEQLAAASLHEAAARASSDEERCILQHIADEEQGHAELSWATLRWAVGAKPGARDALRAALCTLRLRGAPADVLLLDEVTGPALALAMLEGVVVPAAYALLTA